jgi:hypothetical protein
MVIFLRDSRYGMPAVQSMHLAGITLFLATVVMLNLRLAGVGLIDEPLLALERQLTPWAIGALSLVVLSGALIFLGTPAKYANSHPFQVKMAVLGLAIAFHAGVLRRFVTHEHDSPRRGRLVVAGLSLTLWFLVGWAGRAIAFVP